MKVFLFEYFTACNPAAPEFAEGCAILQTLANSFLELGISTSIIFHNNCPISFTGSLSDSLRRPNFTVKNNPGWVLGSKEFGKMYAKMVLNNDAVLVIAPETSNILLGLTSLVENHGKINLGSPVSSIAKAQNKYFTYKALLEKGIDTPLTFPAGNLGEAESFADQIGYPLIIKPCVGEGGEGVYLVEGKRELRAAVAGAMKANDAAANAVGTFRADGLILVQEHIRGTHMSATILGGAETKPLSLNEQIFDGFKPFKYKGGKVAVRHPNSDDILNTAGLAWDALGGLKGYGGVDLVFCKNKTFVVEINPRPTTPLIALDQCLENNLAEMLLGALSGKRPCPVFRQWNLPFRVKRRV